MWNLAFCKMLSSFHDVQRFQKVKNLLIYFIRWSWAIVKWVPASHATAPLISFGYPKEPKPLQVTRFKEFW